MKISRIFFVLILCLPFQAFAEVWSLEKIVEYGSSNIPEINIAKDKVNEAEAALGQANAFLWPQFEVQSSYIYTNNPIAVFGSALNQRKFPQSLNFNNVPEADNLNVKGILTYPLYTGGEIGAKREAATAMLESSKLGEEAVRRDFLTLSAISFLEIQKIDEFIKVIEASIKSLEANRKAAEARVSAGTALKTDLLDIKVQLSKTKEDLVHTQNAKRIMLASLKSLLNIDDENFEISRDVKESDFELNDINDNIKERAELKSINAKEDAALAEIESISSAYLPKLYAQGSYEQNKGWQFDGNGSNYTGGVLLKWDIWNGKLTKNKINEANSKLSELRNHKQKLKNALALQVEQSKLRLNEAKESLKVGIESCELAKESVELARLRFEQGLASSTQLIEAERAYTAAKVRKAQAKTDQYIATIQLRRAVELPILKDN